MLRKGVVAAVLLPLICSACSEGPGSVVPYPSRFVTSGSAEELFAAAVPIMQREFGRVTPDRANLTVVAPPQEYRAGGERDMARDLVSGGQATLRRTATLQVRKRSDGVVAELRVDIERKEPRAAAAQPSGSRLNDLPSYTPIEREAATKDAQNAVWVKVRRDAKLERELLDELRDWATSVRETSRPAADTNR